MAEIYRIEDDEHTTIFIETKKLNRLPDEVYVPGVQQTGVLTKVKERINKEINSLPKETLEKISKNVATFSKLILSSFDKEFCDEKPEISIGYGVNIVGEFGIEVVKASGEATLNVSVTWNKK